MLQIGLVSGIALAVILFLGFGAFSSLFTTDLEVLTIAWSGILVRNYRSESLIIGQLFTFWIELRMIIVCALLKFHVIRLKYLVLSGLVKFSHSIINGSTTDLVKVDIGSTRFEPTVNVIGNLPILFPTSQSVAWQLKMV